MTEFQRRFQRRPIPLTIGGCISVSRIVLHLGKDKSITRLFRKIRPYHTSSQLAFEHQAGLFQHAHRGKVLRVASGPYSVDSRNTLIAHAVTVHAASVAYPCPQHCRFRAYVKSAVWPRTRRMSSLSIVKISGT